MNHGLPQRHDLYSETALNMGNEFKLWRQDVPPLQKHVGNQEMSAGARSRIAVADTRGDLALDEDFHRNEHTVMTATQRDIELLRCHLVGTPRGKRSLDGDLTRRVTQQEMYERHQLHPKTGSRIFLPDPMPVDQPLNAKTWPRSPAPVSQHLNDRTWPRSASPVGSRRRRQVGLPQRLDLFYAETTLNMGNDHRKQDWPQPTVGEDVAADARQLQPEAGSRIFLPTPPPAGQPVTDARRQLQTKMGSRIFLPDPPLVGQCMDATRLPR